jgi:hypothetical protein
MRACASLSIHSLILLIIGGAIRPLALGSRRASWVLPGTHEARQTGTMISTYLSYRSFTADLTKTLTRVSLEAQVSRDAQYYKDNIGKVKSVDDFIDNTRLFSYAMKAYGL